MFCKRDPGQDNVQMIYTCLNSFINQDMFFSWRDQLKYYLSVDSCSKCRPLSTIIFHWSNDC